MGRRMIHRGGAFGLCAAVLFCLSAFVASGAALAEPTKFYDEARSLMGGCVKDSRDEVEDPGCPGGEHPPEGPFETPNSVATDAHGNVYVVNNRGWLDGEPFHIDIFDSTGHYVGQVEEERYGRQAEIAVDSTGHLYVYAQEPESLLRYDPTAYNPEAGEIEYGSAPVTVSTRSDSFKFIEINPGNDHLYLRLFGKIAEYDAASDGVPNELITESIGQGTLADWSGPLSAVAVDASRNRLYAMDWEATTSGGFVDGRRAVVRVFDAEPPHGLLGTIDGSSTPNGHFGTVAYSWTNVTLAVDEASGHLFAGNLSNQRKLHELEQDGAYVGTIENPKIAVLGHVGIAIDNSEESPNQGYLYVPSGDAVGHLYAYEPKALPQPPVVGGVSFGGVSEDEALLRARINPKGEPAHWTLEYASEEDFQAKGFEGAAVAGEGEISPGDREVEVFAPATGLAPGTTYRFRARAENQCEVGGCTEEAQGSFTTFAPVAAPQGCANQALRSGASASLPDCRAYELVTPPDTNGLAPIIGPLFGTGASAFPTPPASPDGESFAFLVSGGVLPGFEGGSGGVYGDQYAARRGAAGWGVEQIGPDGTQATYADPGGLSPDHDYFQFNAGKQGSLVLDGQPVDYLRYPDGSFRLPGQGSLATAHRIQVHNLAAAGEHTVFSVGANGGPAIQLEPAAPSGGAAIYDRTADGTLHVVSLLPGELTPEGSAFYLGSSAEGSAVAFELGGGGPIYLRLDNAETLQAAPAGAQFASLTEQGRHLFYMLGGDLHRFDSDSEQTTQISESGDVEPVNFPSEGTGAYYLSASALPTAPNPLGAEPQGGAQNLYHYDGAATRFVATVTDRDAEGTPSGVGFSFDGLGLWMSTVARGFSQAVLPSRTSEDGSVLAFASRADLSGFESGGKAQIFRYDGAAATLQCVSCDPTGAAPGADARLLRYDSVSLITPFSEVPNLSADGGRLLFETDERLALADNDGLTDVYEWEAQGKGSCTQPGGCTLLLSSGQSARPELLVGASRSGQDVFIHTSDLLVGADSEETPSIYDARVGGGFASPPARSGECLGEACQPAARAPEDPTPTSSTFQGAGNLTEPAQGRPRCPKGKRAVRRAGKRRCVARHKQQRRRAAAERRGAR